MYFDENQDTWIIEFSPEYKKENEEIIEEIIDRCFGGRGSVEILEQLFDIQFAAGIENGEPIFLSKLNDEDAKEEALGIKYDGMVCLSTPPLDNQTGKPFMKNKLTFKIKIKENKDYTGNITGLINSKIRNKITLSI